jgi:hypothetical protein
MKEKRDGGSRRLKSAADFSHFFKEARLHKNGGLPLILSHGALTA